MHKKKTWDIARIYQTWYDDIYRYVWFLTSDKNAVEDIVQNTFIKVMTNLDTFRGDCQLKSWILLIARNECIRYAKINQKHRECMELEENLNLINSVSIDDIYLSRETSAFILEHIRALPEPKKTLMILRLVEDLPFTEISIILGKSASWCRVTFMREKNVLLKRLEELECQN